MTQHQQNRPDFGGAPPPSRQISESEIKIIAEAAADMAISNLFEIFGVDVTTKDGRKGVQDDLSWLREARVGTSALRKAGWRTVWGALITAVLIAIWKGIGVVASVGAKVP